MTKQGVWNSFEQLIPELEQLISGQKKDYAAYNALSDSLRQFNEYLIPEITKDKEGHYILIISCDGYERGIPAVEELTADIKDYPNWIIVRYRQPGPMEWIPFKGQNVRRKNIGVTWEKTSPDQYILTFYLKWYLNNPTQQSGAILHLDHTIGEYAAMTKIQSWEFKSLWPFQSKDGLKTLDELKAEMDK